LARSGFERDALYNKRGTCEQWMKEGKGAIKWTRLSCRMFAANAVRLQLTTSPTSCGRWMSFKDLASVIFSLLALIVRQEALTSASFGKLMTSEWSEATAQAHT
jgi:hypothetical protein